MLSIKGWRRLGNRYGLAQCEQLALVPHHHTHLALASNTNFPSLVDVLVINCVFCSSSLSIAVSVLTWMKVSNQVFVKSFSFSCSSECFTQIVWPFMVQIVSLHPEPAPGAAELRPLAAPNGQERVSSWPLQTLPADGDVWPPPSFCLSFNCPAYFLSHLKIQ